MGALSVWHWLILLAVVVLVFGTGKLKHVGKDLGSAIRGFKEGLKEERETADELVAPKEDKKQH